MIESHKTSHKVYPMDLTNPINISHLFMFRSMLSMLSSSHQPKAYVFLISILGVIKPKQSHQQIWTKYECKKSIQKHLQVPFLTQQGPNFDLVFIHIQGYMSPSRAVLCLDRPSDPNNSKELGPNCKATSTDSTACSSQMSQTWSLRTYRKRESKIT